MESHIQELLPETCRRPRHFIVDRWYRVSNRVIDAEPRIAYRSGREIDVVRIQKATRRLERWWRKVTDDYPVAPPSEKFLEAKRQRFTADGKPERVSRSLAALSQEPYIRLAPDEWRQIVEDPDLEDQSL